MRCESLMYVDASCSLWLRALYQFKMYDFLVLVGLQNAQVSGDVNVADEQRRFASYAASDVQRFEEQRAALLRWSTAGTREAADVFFLVLM